LFVRPFFFILLFIELKIK